MSEIEIELEPCPFCGGEADFIDTKLGLFIIECVGSNCVVFPRLRVEGYGDKESIIASWNKRAPVTPDPTPALLSEAARQIEAAMGEDMQEAADVLTVWGWMKAHPDANLVSQQLRLDRVHIGDSDKLVKAWFQERDGDDWLHQAADWIRRQESQP